MVSLRFVSTISAVCAVAAAGFGLGGHTGYVDALGHAGWNSRMNQTKTNGKLCDFVVLKTPTLYHVETN